MKDPRNETHWIGYFLAMDLGKNSPNIKTKKVIIPVANPVATLIAFGTSHDFNKSVKNNVEIVDEATLDIVLEINIVDNVIE